MTIRSTYQSQGTKTLLPFTGKGFVAIGGIDMQDIMGAGLSNEMREVPSDWTRRHG